MTSIDLANFIMSGDGRLVGAALVYLFVQGTKKVTPDNWFTTPTQKRLAAGFWAVFVSVLTVFGSGLAAHVSWAALLGMCITSFLGAPLINKIFSPNDGVSISSSTTVVNKGAEDAKPVQSADK